jgi:pyruvate/2-oxoglutarate dehydrogenase complex dihydrolipoamide dehydrogenase (E3) component
MHRTILPRHQIPALLMMMIFSTFVQQSRALSSAAPPVSKSYDLVVIGGGSAGLTAAKFAATFKKSVVIIEESRLGGDCTWSGCVPSKALIASAKAAHTARTSESYGVSTGRVKVDMKAIRDRMARIQQRIYEKDDSPEAMKKLGIETLSGRATFQSPSTLDVAGETPQRIEARLGVIVATGASPKKPTDKIDGLEKVEYFTYEDIFGLETLPDTMTIVGGGPIGCELAQTYARLGVKVTQVATKLLMREEPEVCKVMEEAFAEDGVERIKGRMVRVESAKRGTAHKGSCKLEDGSEVVITGDLLLVAAGRSPNVKGFGLEELGVKFNDKGGIETDDMLQSSVNRVYAAGDCTGGKQL